MLSRLDERSELFLLCWSALDYYLVDENISEYIKEKSDDITLSVSNKNIEEIQFIFLKIGEMKIGNENFIELMRLGDSRVYRVHACLFLRGGNAEPFQKASLTKKQLEFINKAIQKGEYQPLYLNSQTENIEELIYE